MSKDATIPMKARAIGSGNAAKMIRVLVADDHLVYRIGIRNLLAAEPGFDVIGEAADGNQAIEMYRRLCPDVLLLDLRMPQKSGIEVVRAVRAEFSDARILIVTSYQTEEEIFQVLQAGALGYVIKMSGGRCWYRQSGLSAGERVGSRLRSANNLTIAPCASS